MFVLVAGTTETARIDGISAAGAEPSLLAHTPSADLEIVAYGEPIGAPVVPVSPTGCPTPAVITRAARELLGFETVAVDAGLAKSTRAPTVTLGDESGRDIRAPEAVPNADEVFESARSYTRSLHAGELRIGETVPGGTTTALGVLTALGEHPSVSSSLPENPLALKRDVVERSLAASDLAPGAGADNPIETLRRVGDPVLAGVAGLIVGACQTDTPVTLAGGTQMAAAAALARHAGVEAPIELATTSFLAADETAGIETLAADLSLEVTVTDPGFEEADHPAMDAYVAGEAKEGVGMGGALALVERSDISMADLREQITVVYDRLLEEPPEP